TSMRVWGSVLAAEIHANTTATEIKQRVGVMARLLDLRPDGLVSVRSSLDLSEVLRRDACSCSAARGVQAVFCRCAARHGSARASNGRRIDERVTRAALGQRHAEYHWHACMLAPLRRTKTLGS